MNKSSDIDYIVANIRHLKSEIKSLNYLSNNLMNEITELRENQLQIYQSKTIKGKFFNIIGYIFSIYCIYRIFMSTINLIFKRNPKKDPITRLFDIITIFFNLSV